MKLERELCPKSVSFLKKNNFYKSNQFNEYYLFPQIKVHSSSNVDMIRNFMPNSAGERNLLSGWLLFLTSESFTVSRSFLIESCIPNLSTLYGPNKKLVSPSKKLDLFSSAHHLLYICQLCYHCMCPRPDGIISGCP